MGYKAFLSYARADDKLAKWLHNRLDRYRTPKDLVGEAGVFGAVPDKLHPIFRDRTDLEAGGQIEASLRRVLEQSECLVILCTPASAKSTWVNLECEAFLDLGRSDRIFPVIGAGEPGSGDPRTECLPPALRGKGVLAADLRQIKTSGGQTIGDGRDVGALKLIAGLLGVPLDRLAQREHARRRGRLLMAALGASVMIGVATLAGIGFRAADRNFIESGRNAERARNTGLRFFATRAWERLEAGDDFAAARYALAGAQLSTEATEVFWSALAGVMHAAGESLPPLLHGGPLKQVSFSPDGARLVTLGRVGPAKVWNVSDGRLTSELAHETSLASAEYSLDGGRIVTASEDGSARVWDADTGGLLLTLSGHKAPLSGASFSSDGAKILTAGWDGAVTVWDAASGGVSASFKAHGGGVPSAVFSPNGAAILTTGRFGEAALWDSGTGRLIASLTESSSGYEVNTAAFSPDGSAVVTAGRDGIARVWSTDGGLEKSFKGFERTMHAAAFAPNGTDIVVTGIDAAGPAEYTAKVWDVGDGQIESTFIGHRGHLDSATFAPDGAAVVTVSEDRTAKVWDAADGRLLASYGGGSVLIRSARFSPDGTHLATMDEGGAVRVWKAPFGRKVATVAAIRGAMDVAAFSPDGSLLLTSGEDRFVRIWSVEEARTVSTLPGRASGSDSFSPDGKALITADGDAVTVWTIADWTAAANLAVKLQGSFGSLDGAAFSKNGERIAAASQSDNAVFTWNVADGRPLTRLRGPTYAASLLTARFSPQGGRILVAAQQNSGPSFSSESFRDYSATVWDAETGARVAKLQGHRFGILDAVFSPDGAHVATASADSTANIWSTSDWSTLATLSGHEDRVSVVRFSPDGARLLTAGWDDSARIWNVPDGRPIAILKGHTSLIKVAEFSADGARVFTAGADDTVRVWNASDGQPLATLHGHLKEMNSADMTPDGAFLATASIDGKVILWDSRRLTQSREILSRDACVNLLGPTARTFSQAELDGDPLLAEHWSSDRDVCDEVAGVPSLSDLRRDVGIHAHSPGQKP